MDDTINRQAAIDSIMEEPSEARYPVYYAEKIRQLPSEQPERKGEWTPGREIAREMCGDAVTAIFYENCSCSVCGYSVQNIPLWNFCPICGADMRREDNA